MSFERLWLIPMAMMIGGLALVAVFAAQRDAGTKQDIRELLGHDYAAPSSVTAATRYEDTVLLGTYEDMTYFAGFNPDGGDLCFAQQIERGDDSVAAGTCTPLDRFEQGGMGTALTGSGLYEPKIAYLLPHGYEEAAAGLPWGRLVAPNLLIVDDIEAHAGRIVELVSSEPGQNALTLHLLSASN